MRMIMPQHRQPARALSAIRRDQYRRIEFEMPLGLRMHIRRRHKIENRIAAPQQQSAALARRIAACIHQHCIEQRP